MSPGLGEEEHQVVLLTEPEENVLESCAASLVSLGKYDLSPLPALMILSVQNLLRVQLILRHLRPPVLGLRDVVGVRPGVVTRGEVISQPQEDGGQQTPDVEQGLESLAHPLLSTPARRGVRVTQRLGVSQLMLAPEVFVNNIT